MLKLLLCNFFESNMQAYIYKLHISRKHKQIAIWKVYKILAKIKKAIPRKKRLKSIGFGQKQRKTSFLKFWIKFGPTLA